MTDECWDLAELDPAARARALREAAARGLSVSEYLAEILRAAAASAPASPGRGIDAALSGFAARLDNAEAEAAQAFETLQRTLREAGAKLANMDARLEAAEAELCDHARSSQEAQAALVNACGELEQRVSDAETAAQTAQSQMHQAHAALAADFALEQQKSRDALGALRTGFTASLVELQERHLRARSRIEDLDSALAAAMRDLARLRADFAAGAEASHTDSAALEAHLARRIDALARQGADFDERLGETRLALAADIERVEACTLAALEKLAGDRKAGEASLRAALEAARAEAREADDKLSRASETEAAALRGRLAGVLARLDSLDAAIDGDASPAAALEQRITALEQRQQQGFEALRADIARFVADNDARLAALETAPENAQGDFAAAFAELRRRIEARVLDVESRSVGALERLAETVAAIEQRLAEPDSGPDQAKASA